MLPFIVGLTRSLALARKVRAIASAGSVLEAAVLASDLLDGADPSPKGGALDVSIYLKLARELYTAMPDEMQAAIPSSHPIDPTTFSVSQWELNPAWCENPNTWALVAALRAEDASRDADSLPASASVALHSIMDSYAFWLAYANVRSSSSDAEARTRVIPLGRSLYRNLVHQPLSLGDVLFTTDMTGTSTSWGALGVEWRQAFINSGTSDDDLEEIIRIHSTLHKADLHKSAEYWTLAKEIATKKWPAGVFGASGFSIQFFSQFIASVTRYTELFLAPQVTPSITIVQARDKTRKLGSLQLYSVAMHTENPRLLVAEDIVFFRPQLTDIARRYYETKAALAEGWTYDEVKGSWIPPKAKR